MTNLKPFVIPCPLFETERTQVFPFISSDFDDLKRLHQHPDVYSTTITGFSNDQKVQTELEDYMDEYKCLGISQLKVMTKGEIPQFIGRVGLQLMTIDPSQQPSYELRFAIMPTHWGKGLDSWDDAKVINFVFKSFFSISIEINFVSKSLLVLIKSKFIFFNELFSFFASSTIFFWKFCTFFHR
jgi:hypothetical protein